MYLLLIACATDTAPDTSGASPSKASGPRYDVRDFYCDGGSDDPAEGDRSAYSTEIPIMIQALALYGADELVAPLYDMTQQLGMLPGHEPLVPGCEQSDVPVRYRLTVVYAPE